MKPLLLSVIIPVYNEPKILENINHIKEYLEKKKINYEIIAVDDFSKKEVSSLLDTVKNKKIRIIKNKKNMGKGYTVKTGMLNSKGDYALFIDADLSIPIEELEKFLNYAERYDVIISSRKNPTAHVMVKQGYSRSFLGSVFKNFVNILIMKDFDDTQCGCKLFNMKKARKIFEKQTINGFSFDVEVLYLAKKYNLKIKEMGIHIYNTRKSSVKLIKHSALMLLDLFKIKYRILTGKYG